MEAILSSAAMTKLLLHPLDEIANLDLDVLCSSFKFWRDDYLVPFKMWPLPCLWDIVLH